MAGISYEKVLASIRDSAMKIENFRHAIMLANVMRWFAGFRGHEEKADIWAAAGLVRRSAEDVNLKKAGVDKFFIESARKNTIADADAQSPITDDEEMFCLLITLDHLSSLVSAVAGTRPGQGLRKLKVSAVQKKFRDRAFQPDISRMLILQGARRMRWEIGDLTSKTIKAVTFAESESSASQ